jgi:hypothetical protein
MTLAAKLAHVPAQNQMTGSDGTQNLTDDGARRTVTRYDLARPTVGHVRQSLERLVPEDFDSVWNGLLEESGIHGFEQDRESLERLLTVMTLSVHPITAICARAQAVRLASFDHLSANHPTAEVEPPP